MNFLDAFRNNEIAKTLRGGESVDLNTALRRGQEFRSPFVPLLGVPIPASLMDRGVVVQGGQGFGKTLTVIESVVYPPIVRMREPGNREKLILVDVKGDLTPVTLGLAKISSPAPRVVLLNPFDRFASSLDPYELADEPTKITRLISSLTYRRKDARTDEFFDGAARTHLVDLVKILQRRAPGRWTWRHLYLIATTYGLLARVLKRSRIGRRKAGAIVKKSFAGIVSTIQSWLDQYEAAFACMVRSASVSITDFLKGSGILILTVPEDQIESLSPLVRTVLRHVKDRLLTDNGKDPLSHTTIVLDEFAYLDNCVEVIEPLFGRARSARVTTVCAWQSWPAVCAAHTELRMKGIVDNAALRVWLGCGAASAEIAAKDCMSCEVVREDGMSFRPGHSAHPTVSYRHLMRTNVLPSEIQSIHPPTPADPVIRAFLCMNHVGGPLYCEKNIAAFITFLNALPPVAAIRPRPSADLWLDPWDDVADGNLLAPLFKAEK